MHSIQIDSRNRQITAAMRAHRDQNRIKALPSEIAHREVPPCRLIQFEFDAANVQNLADLRFDHVSGQAVFGNAEIQHPSGNRRSLKNCDRITHQGQIVRSGQTYWAATNHRNFERQFGNLAPSIDV